MCVTVSEILSHLCKILTPVIVKTYPQTGRRRYLIARRPVVKGYFSLNDFYACSGPKFKGIITITGLMGCH